MGRVGFNDFVWNFFFFKRDEGEEFEGIWNFGWVSYPRKSIPYQRLYRFGQQYEIFQVPVNTGVPFRDYR